MNGPLSVWVTTGPGHTASAPTAVLASILMAKDGVCQCERTHTHVGYCVRLHVLIRLCVTICMCLKLPCMTLKLWKHTWAPGGWAPLQLGWVVLGWWVSGRVGFLRLGWSSWAGGEQILT